MENCKRCGRPIGDTEKVYLYRDQRVCQGCWHDLKPPESAPTGARSTGNLATAPNETRQAVAPPAGKPPLLEVPAYAAAGACANCGEQIGALEKQRRWKNQPVCTACWKKLTWKREFLIVLGFCVAFVIIIYLGHRV